jgi:hypothetical protein
MTAPALDPTLGLTVRAALSVLFVWSASHKLREVAAFRTALADYQLVPARWLGSTAGLLMAAELYIAVGLWFPGCAVSAACAAAGLLTIYAAAIGINLLRGRRDLDCGCAGFAQHQPLRAALVTRNAVLAAAALASALPAGSRSLTWVDGFTVFVSVAALALLYAAVDGLLINAPRLGPLARATTHA